MKVTISYENERDYMDAIKALSSKFNIVKTSKPYKTGEHSPYQRVYAVLDSRKNIKIKTLKL